jgi:lysozyme family protein
LAVKGREAAIILFTVTTTTSFLFLHGYGDRTISLGKVGVRGMDTFDQAFGFVIGQDGNHVRDAADPAHWTGGRGGVGACRGKKWGIRAAAYPDCDIAGLTLAQAKVIYRRDYWDRLHCDELPAALALLVFDAAVTNGIRRAARWLQAVAKVSETGEIGPATLMAIKLRGDNGFRLCAEFQANRLLFMTGPARWRTSGDGWARRLSELPFEALQMGIPAGSPAMH